MEEDIGILSNNAAAITIASDRDICTDIDVLLLLSVPEEEMDGREEMGTGGGNDIDGILCGISTVFDRISSAS